MSLFGRSCGWHPKTFPALAGLFPSSFASARMTNPRMWTRRRNFKPRSGSPLCMFVCCRCKSSRVFFWRSSSDSPQAPSTSHLPHPVRYGHSRSQSPASYLELHAESMGQTTECSKCTNADSRRERETEKESERKKEKERERKRRQEKGKRERDIFTIVSLCRRPQCERRASSMQARGAHFSRQMGGPPQ